MIKATVVFHEYATNGDDCGDLAQVKTYEGKDDKEVMDKIALAHSYDFEGQHEMSAKELYENTMEVNGDGCDYIVGIFVGELVEYKPK